MFWGMPASSRELRIIAVICSGSLGSNGMERGFIGRSAPTGPCRIRSAGASSGETDPGAA